MHTVTRREATSSVTSWFWFIASYAPLWGILALRFDPWWLRGVLLLLTFLGFGVVYLKLRTRDARPTDTTITIIGDAGGEVSGYLAAYLLPFLTVADPGGLDIAAYVLFFLVAGVIYVRSSLVHINPTMYVLRWRSMCASIPVGEGRKEVFVLTRRNLRTGDILHGERIADRVWIDHDQQS